MNLCVCAWTHYRCVDTHATHTALAAVSPLSGHKEPVWGPGGHRCRHEDSLPCDCVGPVPKLSPWDQQTPTLCVPKLLTPS